MTDLIDLPQSYRGRIIPDDIFPQRKHPDVRLARRANTIAALARVISERKVTKALRTTLLTQAQRLERLAAQRLAEFAGTPDEAAISLKVTINQIEATKIKAGFLDTHRKRQQEQHPCLTLTGIYNVLEKLRSSEPLTAKEKQIHDQDLVTVLRQIHDELDEAVLEAYGWSDLRSRDIPVANKEAPHSCGAGESAADAPREALSPSAPLSPSREECRDSVR